MSGFIDLTGHKYGMLTVLYRIGSKRSKTKVSPLWFCSCECGAITKATSQILRKKDRPRSCGCMKLINTKAANTTHGMHGTSVYRSWNSMKNRCLNFNNKDYSRYGGIGITVCARWHSFVNFYKDMGDKPEGFSIERVNNSEGYYPENCIWANNQTQSSNRFNNNFIEIDGAPLTYSEVERKLNFSRGLVGKRLGRGWSIRKTINTPPMVNFSRRRSQC